MRLGTEGSVHSVVTATALRREASPDRVMTPPAAGAGEHRIASTDGVELEGHLAPGQGSKPGPGLLLLHGFPSGSLSADNVGKDQPELADRIAIEMGWTVLSIRMRGCGTSTGDFSLASWIDDARAGLAYLAAVMSESPNRGEVDALWLVGFGTGGVVGLNAAAEDDRVRGAALAGAPADFDDWAEAPERLLAHAHEAGAIKTPSFPDDLSAWKSELSEVRATNAAEKFAPRPLLVLHGSEDGAVPSLDARMVADAHGAAELRLVSGAGHQLRHDPRAIAVLLGWLERTRNEAGN